MPKPLKKSQEFSLDAPPVYRRFLAGGPEMLRLSAPGVGLIIVLGVLTTVTSMAFREFRQPGLSLSSGTAATIAALATAAIAARWLGGRVGVSSGCLYLLSGRTLLGTGSLGAGPTGDHWIAAMAVAAVGAVALGNVAGRLPPVCGRRSTVVFYCLAAAILAAILAAASIVWFLPEQYSTAWPRPPWMSGDVFSAGYWSDLAAGLCNLLAVTIPIDLLPWGPLALVAIVVGIRQGHHATPFGRFLTVWVAMPLVLALLGLLGPEAAAALIFPPLTILCGLGLCEILTKTARWH